MVPHARLIVTRPEPQASHWVQALRHEGVDAWALPLIDIVTLDSPALQTAREQLSADDAVMFVSPSAVSSFFSQPVTQTARCYLATGPGTVQALLNAGIAANRIDSPAPDAAQFDSEALWAQLASLDWKGRSVLVVRGQGQTQGRDWLSQQLQTAGAQVRSVIAYARRAPHWSSDQYGQLQTALTHHRCVWLFSSSEAIRHLQQLCPDGNEITNAHACCICTHDVIAQTAKAAGFSHVLSVRPRLEEIVQLWHMRVNTQD